MNNGKCVHHRCVLPQAKLSTYSFRLLALCSEDFSVKSVRKSCHNIEPRLLHYYQFVASDKVHTEHPIIASAYRATGSIIFGATGITGHTGQRNRPFALFVFCRAFWKVAAGCRKPLRSVKCYHYSMRSLHPRVIIGRVSADINL